MLNSWGLNRSLGGAISTILLVSVLSSGAVLATLDQLQDATDARARSSQTIRALGDFRAAMLNQETGLRGYLLTGHPSSLEPYRAGRPALDDAIGRLQSLISNDTETSRLLSDAIAAARAWQTKIGETAVSSASDPTTKPEAIRIEADGTGKQFFDTLRQKLARLIHRAVVCGVFWADGARDRASVLTRVDLDRSVSTGGTGAGLWGHHGPLV